MSGYDDYYGFRETPFSLTPDPKFVYSSPSHERALETILHALNRREGLILVTGDIGCGKTTLCRRLVPMLPARTFLSLVLNPFLTADDLLKQVLEDFGLVSAADIRSGSMARATCHELARTLQEFLNSLAQMNATAVIIVDESQNLPLRTLEQIRLLSNFETDRAKLLQIILVGQRNLEPILELEEMRQLNQRVSRRCRVEALSPPEVAAYVECRLATAMPERQTPRVRFTTSALSGVARLSDGVPRIINLICDRALEIAHASASGGAQGAASEGSQLTAGTAVIDGRLVVAAAKDLELPIPSGLRFAPVLPFRPAVVGATAAAVLAAIALWFVVARAPWPLWSSALRATPAVQSRPAAVAAAPAADIQPATPTSPTVDALGLRIDSTAPATTVMETAPSYQLTVASFETAGRAAAVASDLVGRGHPARVAASGNWNVVLVGPYSSLSEAENAKDTLEKFGFSGIKIAKSQ
jgi:general secretion pathway protein A